MMHNVVEDFPMIRIWIWTSKRHGGRWKVEGGRWKVEGGRCKSDECASR